MGAEERALASILVSDGDMMTGLGRKGSLGEVVPCPESTLDDFVCLGADAAGLGKKLLIGGLGMCETICGENSNRELACEPN